MEGDIQMKLVIDRNVWLRGEGSDASRLKRGSDGKFCCIGLYLKECGVDDFYLEGIPDAPKLVSIHSSNVLPVQAGWLVRLPSAFDAPSGGAFYEANDYEIPKEDLSELEEVIFKNEAEREKKIKEMFLVHGVEVEFIN
jgi:hypothetical protein